MADEQQPPTDTWIARGVVLFLGATGLAIAIGSIITTATGATIDKDVLMLGSAAIGGLTALLARVH